MTKAISPLRIPDEAKQRIRMLFMAKHALFGGGMHPEDGNHAIYHHEVRSTLEELGLNLQPANTYEALFRKPEVDFVFPLLNRGGFVNSEMLVPILCNKHGISYLGAMLFLRGLGDDKSVSKLVCEHAGVPTAPWFCYRRGAPVLEKDLPTGDAGRWVVKPNASSASWGITDAHDWNEVANAIRHIHAEGHDAIVEPYLDGYDIQCAFITIDDEPTPLPMLWYEREDTQRLWTYYEKRDLVENKEKAALKRFEALNWPRKSKPWQGRSRGNSFHSTMAASSSDSTSKPATSISSRSTSTAISGPKRSWQRQPRSQASPMPISWRHCSPKAGAATG